MSCLTFSAYDRDQQRVDATRADDVTDFQVIPATGVQDDLSCSRLSENSQRRFGDALRKRSFELDGAAGSGHSLSAFPISERSSAKLCCNASLNFGASCH